MVVREEIVPSPAPTKGMLLLSSLLEPEVLRGEIDKSSVSSVNQEDALLRQEVFCICESFVAGAT